MTLSPILNSVVSENTEKINLKEVLEDNFSEKEFICELCGKVFKDKLFLISHLNCHSTEGTVEDYKPNEEKEITNICNICLKKFTAKKNLMKHLRDVHKNFQEAQNMLVKKIKCPEENCNFKCRMMKDLRGHIEFCHNIKVLKDTLQFSSEAAFLKWKKEEESNTVSWFVTGRKKTTLTDGTKKQTLYCHRTGHYNPRGSGKYRKRAVGSCKIGVTCPAAMDVTESSEGQFTVIYYKTHLGHRQDVVYLKLSREERSHLAEKIEQGFTFDAILDDVKDDVRFKNSTKRIHLLSKKDLYSIMKSNSGRKGKRAIENKKITTCEPTVQIKESSTSENLESSNEQIEKADKNLQQNITLYPGEGVIFPQESSTVREHHSTNFSRQINSPQTSGDNIPSQIVILSRDVDYASVAKIILLSPGETLSQSRLLSDTEIFQSKDIPSQKEISSVEISVEEKNKRNRLNLRLQLKEKMDKIVEFLPKFELLTPKQFDSISAKLDSILNIFKDAEAKSNIKKMHSRKKGKRKTRKWEKIKEVEQTPSEKVEDQDKSSGPHESTYAVYG